MSLDSNKQNETEVINEIVNSIRKHGYEVTEADVAFVKGYLACIQLKQQSES